MNYKTILRYNPELRLCDIQQISTRLLKITKGNMFLAYNTLHDSYELHTVKSFKYTGVSLNATLDDDMLSAWLIKDVRAYSEEGAKDRRAEQNHRYESHEDEVSSLSITRGLQMVERTIGRRL